MVDIFYRIVNDYFKILQSKKSGLRYYNANNFTVNGK